MNVISRSENSKLGLELVEVFKIPQVVNHIRYLYSLYIITYIFRLVYNFILLSIMDFKLFQVK